MRRKPWWRMGFAISGVMVLLCGCRIFPEEMEAMPVPVLKAYEVEEYKETPVLRGDIKLEKTIHCEYDAARKEMLGFARGGEYIDQVYVKEGQTVKAGELLAQLMLDELEQQIAQKEYEVRVRKMEKTHLQEDWEITAQAYEIQNDLEGKLEAETAYYRQLGEMEDTISIESLRLEELKEELSQRQIHAGIDGVVTYVRDYKAGERFEEGSTILTISDMNTAVFMVDGENAEYFPVGTEVTVFCGEKEYKVTVVTPEELGLALDQEKETAVYFRMNQPDPTLEDGERGKIYIALDSSEDTLYVPQKAIRSMNGQYYVHMLNEEGLRIRRDVTIGIENEHYTEVVSGLEAGDSVIME